MSECKGLNFDTVENAVTAKVRGAWGKVKLLFMKFPMMLQASSSVQAQRKHLRVYMHRLKYWNMERSEQGAIARDEALPGKILCI